MTANTSHGLHHTPRRQVSITTRIATVLLSGAWRFVRSSSTEDNTERGHRSAILHDNTMVRDATSSICAPYNAGCPEASVCQARSHCPLICRAWYARQLASPLHSRLRGPPCVHFVVASIRRHDAQSTAAQSRSTFCIIDAIGGPRASRRPVDFGQLADPGIQMGFGAELVKSALPAIVPLKALIH